MDRFMKNMDKLYDFTYMSKYGPDWIYSLFIIFITVLIVLYFNLLDSKEYIADNWNEVRCQPQNMALAGIINPPKDGSMSAGEYANNNFQGCLNDMAKKSSHAITMPILSSLNSLTNIWGSFSASLNNMRDYLAKFRGNFTDFIENIMGQIMNMFIEFQKLFVSIRYFNNKISGILTSALMGTLGLYFALVSSFKAIFSLMLNLTVVATVVAIAAMFSIIGIPVGIILIVFIAVLISMMVQMANGFPPVLGDLGFSNVRKPRISKPRFFCFDKDTNIIMKNNTSKKISDIKINDKLKGNNSVYGIFKLSGDHEKNNMYKINDVTVSGNHKVKYLGEWIYVKDCPAAQSIKYDDDIIYNLLTFSKTIQTKDNEFLDYDEITSTVLDKLDKSGVVGKGQLYKNYGLFKNFTGGFHGNTNIKLSDKTITQIKDINVNDMLDDNIKVLGVVEIEARDITTHEVNSLLLRCTPNILHESCLGGIKTIQSVKSTNLGQVGCDKIYHLITDKNYFYVDFLKVYDYDYLIDHYLE
jgi:hypothetical protein